MDEVLDIIIEAGAMKDGTLQEISKIVRKRLEEVKKEKQKGVTI
jgi:hypothetical protein